MVRGARERRGGDHQKPLGVGDGLVGLELFGRHEAHDRMVLAGRLQVLADGEKVDVGGAQVVHDLQNFVPLLAEPDHDAGLAEHRGVEFLDPLQQADRGEVTRAGSHGEILRRHGLEVVVEDVGPCCRHRLDRAFLAQKIGREHFDRRDRASRADRANDRGKVSGAAVIEIVAIDRSHDHMLEAELCRCFGDPSGLGAIERARQAGFDVAERAGARANIAHQHEGRVLLVPALADIGAPRFLADGVQAVRAHDRARLDVASGNRRFDPDPIGLFQRRCVRPVRLLRMARSAAGVENDGHGSSATYLRIGRIRRKRHHCLQARRDLAVACGEMRRCWLCCNSAERCGGRERTRICNGDTQL